jgi:hypothetical protein
MKTWLCAAAACLPCSVCFMTNLYEELLMIAVGLSGAIYRNHSIY